MCNMNIKTLKKTTVRAAELKFQKIAVVKIT